MWNFNTGDCLVNVTASADLTVLIQSICSTPSNYIYITRLTESDQWDLLFLGNIYIYIYFFFLYFWNTDVAINFAKLT